MTQQHVALFEFPTRPGVAPLASAYLQSFATTNPLVVDNYRFSTHVLSVTLDDIIGSVMKVEADIYGFSTYVWNSALVRRILDRLIAERPEARIILGGPQVMHGAASYLRAEHDKMVLCNGEGEHSFRNYLVEMLDEKPDLSRVHGLSFYRDGELITTEAAPRIRELEEIPSPFLTGLIDPREYSFVSYESNRGCPFKCTYCFWGGATNAKVHKFGQDRVLDELTWISENKIPMIFIIDANFGMLQRDVEIAEHIVALKKRTGFPHTVFFNSSKNTPERVTEITRLWSDVGLITAQPVSMQTVSPNALKAIERDNIKDSTYIELQRTLNAEGLQSFLEMIWPLPGETLETFKEGLDELCRMESDSFIVYPLMLINNVKMASQRELYKLETMQDPDPNSEAEIVVSTIDVSNEDYQRGINLTYHMTVLYAFNALRHTMKYVDACGSHSFTQLSSDFWRFCEERPENPYTRFVQGVVSMTGFNAGAGGFIAMGGAIHTALFAGAREFEKLLYDFLEEKGWLEDEALRLRFEIDLLNRPLLYSNAAISDKSPYLKHLSVVDAGPDSLVIRAPRSSWDILRRTVGVEFADTGSDEAMIRIHYRTPSQIAFSAAQSARYYHFHCQARVRGDIRSMAPRYEVATLVPAENRMALAF